MNRQQKAILVLTFLALIFTITLHRPWTDYDTDYPAQAIDTALLLQHCQTVGKPLDPHLDVTEVSRRFAGELACVERLRPRPRALPVSAWQSHSPALPWFGSIIHIGAVVVAILLFALLSYFLLRRRASSIDVTHPGPK